MDAIVKTYYALEWISGARPPVHPNPMIGRQTFNSFEDAAKRILNFADDAMIVSLTKSVEVTHNIDITAELEVLWRNKLNENKNGA